MKKSLIICVLKMISSIFTKNIRSNNFDNIPISSLRLLILNIHLQDALILIQRLKLLYTHSKVLNFRP